MIKVNKRSLGQVKRKLNRDIGNKLEIEMRNEFSLLPSYYYDCSTKICSIVFDETSKVVGSEEWAVAASDTGGDWIWKKEPPYKKIEEWLIKHQGYRKNDRTLPAKVKAIQEKIMKNGIESHYWVDPFLDTFVRLYGDKGSGII